MQDQGHSIIDHKIVLAAPAGIPFSFTATIQEIEKGNSIERLIKVTGPDQQSGSEISAQYHLESSEHNSFLNFFEKLAQNFGLRLPQNRRQTIFTPTFEAAYREVLLQNLDAGMRYGYGDPAVIRVENWGETQETCYYLLTTTNDAPDAFPILRSRNLEDWEFVTYVFPEGKKPAWAAEGELISDYWAPEMHQIGNEFWIYFVARDKQSRELCIGMARSTHPEGPFEPETSPILKGNVIDPHVFVHGSKAYLFWKEDNNDVWPGQLIQLLYHYPELITKLFTNEEDQRTASFTLTLWPWISTLEPMERFLVNQVFIEAIIERYVEFYEFLSGLCQEQPPAIQQEISSVLKFMKTPMYAQELTSDGTGLVGERIKIIENDLAWEAHLVEGMWVTRLGESYYLFYAGNDFSTDQYGIGVAVADSPLGPYRKMTKPFLQSTAEWWAPGHPSVVTAPDGKPTLFLHAYFPGEAGYKQFRALLAVPIQLEKDHVRIG